MKRASDSLPPLNSLTANLGCKSYGMVHIAKARCVGDVLHCICMSYAADAMHWNWWREGRRPGWVGGSADSRSSTEGRRSTTKPSAPERAIEKLVMRSFMVVIKLTQTVGVTGKSHKSSEPIARNETPQRQRHLSMSRRVSPQTHRGDHKTEIPIGSQHCAALEAQSIIIQNHSDVHIDTNADNIDIENRRFWGQQEHGWERTIRRASVPTS